MEEFKYCLNCGWCPLLGKEGCGDDDCAFEYGGGEMRWAGLLWFVAGMIVPGGGNGNDDSDARRSFAFSARSTLFITMKK